MFTINPENPDFSLFQLLKWLWSMENVFKTINTKTCLNIAVIHKHMHINIYA